MKPYYSDDLVTIYHGDCREWMPESVALVLTDPPYEAEFQSLFDALGVLAGTSLSPGASLVTLCGHYQVPAVIAALSKHLRYWWKGRPGMNGNLCGPLSLGVCEVEVSK